MKLSVLYQDILPGLQTASRSVGIKTTLPILANILLQTIDGKLVLSATNLEIGVVKKINCQIEQEGQITVPAKTFLDIITSLSGEKIELEARDQQLKISTQRFSATLNGIEASEFPSIPLSSESIIYLQAEVLQNIIPEVSFAAAVEEGRPILTGILTQINKDSLEMVATDGFRLARKSAKLAEIGNNIKFSSLIPRKTFEELSRLILEEMGKNTEEKIEVSTTENQNQIIFKVGQTLLSSRLIEGQFPAWEKIIPEKFISRVILDRAEMIKALKLATIFSKGENSNIIKIEILNNQFKISSQAKEIGLQETSLEAQVEGEDLIIAFNPRFLIESLQACQSLQVNMEFSGNSSPTLIRPIGEEGLEYVVMPVRLN